MRKSRRIGEGFRVLQVPLGPAQAEELADAFCVIADPARLSILNFMATRQSGEAFVHELAEPLGLSQPTVSHHLKVLLDAGLVEREPRGKRTYYRVVPEQMKLLQGALAPPDTAR